MGLAVSRRPAVFFDRDGCLNADTGYVHRPEDFRWLPGAKAAVQRVNRAGWLAFVVTNQSGIARGLYGEREVEALHAWMSADLARKGAWIDAYRYCPHHPEAGTGPFTRACDCRKPRAGMVRDLMTAWGVDPARSFLVGDQPRDVEAAAAAGIAGYRVAEGEVLAAVRAGLRRHACQGGTPA
ncbi:MAG: HAD family hydrolase [Alphaproteobacteria bacterium]|nr:HAD family hydrolase [Alphaproteobacteria bacterium]